ncbi:unnamed protein product [Enterobius vermicularis]|uniref:RNA helicase n=1 Tax=Enterobius vermicularis TaxID=51028 RepID=A0A0N4UY69_ENTVE|nr:unnamed protein product [Enterobius vermicularis]
MATASVPSKAELGPARRSTAQKKDRRRSSDTFGLLGSLGRGVPLFRGKSGLDQDFSAPDVNSGLKHGYEKKTEGLRKFELREQKTVPIISEPLSLSHAKKKKKERQQKALEEFNRLYGVDYENAKLVISCARSEFNHYEGMRYPAGEIPLVSQYWSKSKYVNDWFTIKPLKAIICYRLCYGFRNSLCFLHSTSFDLGSDWIWEQFFEKLDSKVIENAIKDGYLKPTAIQVRTCLAFASAKHLFVAAETGSGKTAAYAIPLLSQLLRDLNDGFNSKALVLVPTLELMDQTILTFEKLCEGTVVKVYKRNKTDGFSGATLNSVPTRKWDVLVCTPGLSCKVLSQFDTSSVKTVVVDEADMLLDDSFVSILSDIFSLVKLRNSETNRDTPGGARIIFCSASCPETLQDIVDSVVDRESLHYVRSPRIHTLLSHVKQKFIRVREMEKMEKLAEILERPGTKGQSLVFCKDKLTRNYVSRTLTSRGFQNTILGEHNRKEVFLQLAESTYGVIVATDLASRGLDFPYLSHVINYDFPLQMTDYIHRVGRVGRVSSKYSGRVTSFVRSSPEVTLVNAIELAARYDKPISGLEADHNSVVEERSG